jgi:alpha-D-ribose 1-methylphosphonate 5-triphosphate diphosphatase
VFWPNGLAAALAHDAQMAAAGVTTVYDSICAGSVFGQKDYRREIFPQVIRAIEEGIHANAFRIDHKVHIRCELTGDELVDDVSPFADNPLVCLVSLMDHTPGKRQWRNLDHLKRYNIGSGEKTESQHDEDVAIRMDVGPKNMERNWPLIVEMFGSRGVPLATHDDTTEDDVDAGVRSGAVISEFPTTVVAAREAKRRGLATIAGAPNVVRGGSHSGGVAAAAGNSGCGSRRTARSACWLHWRWVRIDCHLCNRRNALSSRFFLSWAGGWFFMTAQGQIGQHEQYHHGEYKSQNHNDK